MPSFVTRLMRLRTLWPLFTILLFLAALDRILLLKQMDHPGVWRKPYAEYATLFDANRPQLVIIGSSRGQAIHADILEQEVRAAGLPYQVVNLSVEGGTPSILWAALNDLEPSWRDLPKGSRVVYVFSPFEMNFLNLKKISELPSGRALLRQDEPDHWLFTLRDKSGLVSYIQGDGIKSLPMLFQKLFLLSTVENFTLPPIDGTRIRPRCMRGGLENYRVRPINVKAFESMAAALGDRLTVIAAPLSPTQRECDRAGGAMAGTQAIHQVTQRSGIRFIADTDDRLTLPDDEFTLDSNHLHTDGGRRAMARFILDQIR